MRHLVICGDNPLAYRLAAELSGQGRLRLTVIVRSMDGHIAPRIGELPRVRLVQAAELTDETFRRADLETADALALVDQDDVGNIHAALRAEEVNPKVRLVIRFFNMSLGERIESMFPDSKVLSDADTAAPQFVAATLGLVAPSHATLPGRPKRTAYVALRSGVPKERVICGLAVTGREGSAHRLPEDEADADLVLALAEGVAPDPLGPARSPRAVAPRRAVRSAWAWVRMVANRKLGLATIGLLGLLGLGTVLFAQLAGYSWSNAVYYTVLDAAGAAQPDARLSTAEKVIQAMITIVGIAFIPVLTAAVVDALVGSRLAVALGRPRAVSGHIVVVGLGNVGSRVVEQLHAVGESVVGVERDEKSRGVSWARRRGLPVVVGDASRPDTLRAASVGTSRALLAVTNNDMINLEAALHARAIHPGVRIVLRLFDEDLALRVQEKFGIEASRSVSFLSAPAFAAAMQRRRVLATVPVGRRVLLVAEVSVSAGCELDGERMDGVGRSGRIRTFALQRRGNEQLELPAPPAHVLGAGDRLLVVATRGGLNDLLRRADPPRPARIAAAGS
jgi:Trk K+ transport system NAD-binding subunit